MSRLVLIALLTAVAACGGVVTPAVVLPVAAAHPEPGDEDGDEVRDENDNCPTTRNGDQLDTDRDGFGDACDGDDDADGVADASDNCRRAPNPGQEDANGNGIGDACDRDSDGDGVSDASDVCRDTPDPGQENLDGDALGDACDDDKDGDGFADTADNCPRLPNEDQSDADGDRIGSACDDAEARPAPPAPPPAAQPSEPQPAIGASRSPDRRAPTLSINAGRSYRHVQLGSGLPVSARCSEACRLTATLFARSLSRTPVAHATAELGARGATYVFIRWNRATAARLRRLRQVTLRVRVTATDAAGNATASTRSVVVRR
jgi:hypothetical protein